MEPKGGEGLRVWGRGINGGAVIGGMVIGGGDILAEGLLIFQVKFPGSREA